MDTSKFKGKIKELFGKSKILVLIGIFIFIMYITDIGCPIKFLTGISCPSCGISRSYMSLLRGDIGKAFYYHAFFPVIIPGVLYLMYGKRPYFGSKRKEKVILGVFLISYIVYYLVRILIFHTSFLSLDIKSGIMLQFITEVLKFVRRWVF